MRPILPIDPLLPVILEKLETSLTLILKATPGSGKTTRVPPALLSSPFLKPDQEIWALVPRRLAAKTAAQRVAQELGEEVGRTVGYQFRFEKVIGPQTRLKFLTEGMLVRLLSLADPPRVGMVILDEFHERHLHTDVALSYLHSLQRNYRPDLRIVVMSATWIRKAFPVI
jgi:ATP-dependent helicase HrpB